ncbi:MAG: hypothetical protein F6K40_04020 [Okeania sp. SIO3I5]|nr:hypothetical protein [Okeania sp. SIO3I5]
MVDGWWWVPMVALGDRFFNIRTYAEPPYFVGANGIRPLWHSSLYG